MFADPELRSALEAGHATGLQTADEIADVVVFLASDASRSLTGAVLTCDRGWSAFKLPQPLARPGSSARSAGAGSSSPS